MLKLQDGKRLAQGHTHTHTINSREIIHEITLLGQVYCSLNNLTLPPVFNGKIGATIWYLG